MGDSRNGITQAMLHGTWKLSRGVSGTVFLLTMLAACGRLGYERVPSGVGDGSTSAMDSALMRDGGDGDGAVMRDSGDGDGTVMRDSGRVMDDGGGGGPCEAWGPWSAPERLASVNSPSDDWRASITADGLEIYLHSWRPGGMGGGDIWVATRSDTAAPFDPAVFLAEVSSASAEFDPFISADGLTLLWASNRTGTAGADLWIAMRADRSRAFTLIGEVPNVNSSNNEYSPWVSPDGKRLYFTSQRPGTGGSDIWMAARPDVSSDFDPPVQVEGVNTTFHERASALSPDEREIYFASTRGAGSDLDIYVATRPDRLSGFETPTELGPAFNTTFDDTDPFVSPDGMTLLLNRDTDTVGGRQSDVWVSTRNCL